MTGKILGRAPELAEAAPGKDRRFKDDAWQQNMWFDYLRQGYLINSQWLAESTGNLQGLDAQNAHKLNFFIRQFVDAMSPSNSVFTNPEVLRATLDSNGDNLVRGLQHLLRDLERGDGKLRITMTDEKAFKLGVDIAATPGQVVYQNDLMQLLHYQPSGKQAHSVPVLITPAWINKYYILDLRPENSLVKWLTDHGLSVFVISWVNPDQNLAGKTFENYLQEGPLAALDVIGEITGSKQTSMIGYCLGGTLTAITLAHLRARGQEKRVASVTYLTTLIDFTEAGDLAVFIDDAQLSSLEERMQEQGYLDASDMANTFNMLRSNDLIWSFVINNYLLGKDPFPFDLLYWNSDATRMPAAMHTFYLRNMYQRNLLAQPNGLQLAGTPINLTKITTPTYILATREDHIAPWQSTYMATQIYDGPVTFTLADSGHIAGVINSPAKQKYCYWVNAENSPTAAQWFAGAKQQDGSWWPHWTKWLLALSGPKIAPQKTASRKYKPIEAAPGSYALVRA
jgi:polyhydroxyalkanoate synthase